MLLIDHVPDLVLAQWRAFAGQPSTRVNAGLINDTFFVTARDGTQAVFQRLHSIFEATVNIDIKAITKRLVEKGLQSPQLIPTDDEALWVKYNDRIWRAITFIPGHTYHKVRVPRFACEAGALVGRFHNALDGFEYSHKFSRGNVHDTHTHIERLRRTFHEHRSHPLRGEVLTLAEPLLLEYERLPDLCNLPLRHAHGDLKISNILFDGTDHAVCLIDLDTLSRMIWPFEMGDALRSWCNPRQEDEGSANLELALLEAALAGYASSAKQLASREEREALIAGLAQICLELASRFLGDALDESYFGWDPTRYETRGAHNLARGRAMWDLYQSVKKNQRHAERIVCNQLG
jgi:Ser/Thr protein kinase RdoA (MazF antagonist)